jgi:hypothetical protein
MLSAVGTMESSMSKAGLDNRHRNKDSDLWTTADVPHGATFQLTLPVSVNTAS